MPPAQLSRHASSSDQPTPGSGWGTSTLSSHPEPKQHPEPSDQPRGQPAAWLTSLGPRHAAPAALPLGPAANPVRPASKAGPAPQFSKTGSSWEQQEARCQQHWALPGSSHVRRSSPSSGCHSRAKGWEAQQLWQPRGTFQGFPRSVPTRSVRTTVFRAGQDRRHQGTATAPPEEPHGLSSPVLVV